MILANLFENDIASGSIFVSFLASRSFSREISVIASLASFKDRRMAFNSLLAVSILLSTVSTSIFPEKDFNDKSSNTFLALFIFPCPCWASS